MVVSSVKRLFHFVRRQVVGLMVYDGTWDSTYANILKAAASSGDKDTWEAVSAKLEGSKVEVTGAHMRPQVAEKRPFERCFRCIMHICSLTRG